MLNALSSVTSLESTGLIASAPLGGFDDAVAAMSAFVSGGGYAFDLGVAARAIRFGITNSDDVSAFLTSLSILSAAIDVAEITISVDRVRGAGGDWREELFVLSVDAIIGGAIGIAGGVASHLSIVGGPAVFAAVTTTSFAISFAYGTIFESQVQQFYREKYQQAEGPDFSQRIYYSPVLDGINSTQANQTYYLHLNSNNLADQNLVSRSFAVVGGNDADVLDGRDIAFVARLEGGAGDDRLYGGLLGDKLSGGVGSDILNGGGGSDSLWGGPGNDSVSGGAGRDNLEGGTGDDFLSGGADGDRYSIGLDQGSDTISDQGGTGSGIDVIAIYTGSSSSTIYHSWFSRDGDDLLIRVPAGAFAWAIDIRIENMNSSAGSVERFELYAGDGFSLTDSRDLGEIWAGLTQPSVPPPSVVPPPAQSNVFTSGDDNVVRGDGNDVLTTRGEGRDSVMMGGGLNTLIVDYTWTDQDVYAGERFHVHSYALGSGVTHNTFVFGLTSVAFFSGSGNDSISGLSGPDTIHGGGGNDRLVGFGGGDALYGEAGDDWLEPGSGVSWIDGGAGDDHWVGNLSAEMRDLIFFSSLAASGSGQTLVDGTHVRNIERVTLTTGSGDDSIRIAGAGQQLTTGSGNDTLYVLGQLGGGNHWDAGLDGNDRLVADLSASTDSVTLSTQDDFYNQVYSYFVHRNGKLHSGTGVYDGYSVQYPVQLDFRLVDSFEVSGGSANDALHGLGGDDILIGNAGDDYLEGRGGNDRLEGGAGSDTLIAGSGVNHLDGGSGTDNAQIDLGGETRSVSFSTQTAASGSGQTLVDGTHVRNIERVTLTTGSGDDSIRIAGAGQQLTTGSGNDTLYVLGQLGGGNHWDAGLDGNDRLVADLSASTDSVTLSTQDDFYNQVYSYFVHRNGKLHSGTGVYDGYSVQYPVQLDFRLVDSFEVSGGSANDALHGLGGDDILIGNAGDDYLEGRGGNDRLEGGAGSDTLIAGSGVNHLDGGSGTDNAQIDLGGETRSVSFSTQTAASGSGQTLVDGTHVRNIERVTLTTGSGDDSIRIAGAGQQLTTGSGNDTLYVLGQLGGGNHWDAGLDGNDRLVADLSASTDSVTLSTQDDFYNQVYSYFVHRNGKLHSGTGVYDGYSVQYPVQLDFRLVDSFEVSGGSANDALHGLGGDDILIGNAGDDYLEGRGGNDRLEGGAGSDTLIGGNGDDIYSVDSLGDSVVEYSGEGDADEVRSSIANYQLPANIERLVYTGSGAGQLSGNAGNNTVTGSTAGDVFQLQQGGDDRASGGAGDDGIYFGAAFTAADEVDGGEGALDQVGLQGGYAGLTLGSKSLVGIEQVVLLPGSDTRFGDTSGALYSYHLTSVDANVAAGQRLVVTANTLRAGESFTWNGAAETDGFFLTYGGLGTDILTGGQQDDGFFFGTDGRFGANDKVDGQGGAFDQLGLQGAYSGANAVTFGADQLKGIEFIVALSGGDARFGGTGAGYSYDLTTNDANVAAGATMVVSANTLRADETLTFNGAAETDGQFRMFAGAAADTLTGGAGNDEISGLGGADRITGGLGADKLTGGEGADTFVYAGAAASTGLGFDTLIGFDYRVDRIDLPGAVTGFTGLIETGALSRASFDADLAAAVDGKLEANSAVIFRASTGDFAGRSFAVIDANGDGVYMAGQDFVIELVEPAVPIQLVSDFFI